MAFGTGGHCEEANLSLSVGVGYVTGDYGGDGSVDETWIPFGAAWQRGRIQLRATVPYLIIDAPQDSASGGQGGMSPGEDSRSTESGLGDIVLSGTLMELVTLSDDAVVDLTVKVKLGTADEGDGMGTGENDYSVQADAVKFFERSLLVGTVGYQLRGDPDETDLDNAWFYSIGGIRALSEGADVGIFLDYRQSTFSEGDDPLELTAIFDFGLTRQADLHTYGLVGFNDSSPDWGLGLSIRHRF